MGILSGSPGLDGAIEAYASGAVDPRPLVAATIDMEEVADILEGTRPTVRSERPKSAHSDLINRRASLSGRVVFVTGAGSGIGEATARLFAATASESR